MAHKKPILSLEELQALANAGAELDVPTSRFWFFARTMICIAIVTANVLSLTLYADRVFGKFDLPPDMLDYLSVYVHSRILIAILGVPLYLLAFFRRLYFLQLSYAFVLLIGVNLTNDWILIYAHVRPEALGSVIAMIGLRLTVMVFLILNARFYARHC